MKRTVIISGIAIAAIAIIVLIVVNVRSKSDYTNLFAEAKRGAFDIVVTTTGELQAKNSTDIYGPEMAQSRNLRAMEIKILDMVPEGTEVKKGDYVATLDRTTLDNNLKDEYDRLESAISSLDVSILDTAVNLSNKRDNIKNLRSSVEEAQLTVKQSAFETQSVQRQAEIALQKAERNLDQGLRQYALAIEQERSSVRNKRTALEEQRQRVRDMESVLEKFKITAPADGMIIYMRERGTSTKRKIGSSISTWDNVVATLPDLSSMISRTYVNEIDVSKVKAGQQVEIMVDAFPEKQFTGQVISVANIGEQLPNTDAKVFEVVIAMNESDPILKPSMTTGNKIITKTIDDVTYIPLESVQNGPDSIPFVYLKEGKKQIVVLGESNENNVVVEQGIEAGTTLYLNTPEKPETFEYIGQDLIAVIKEREKQRREEEERLREEAQKNLMGRGSFQGGQMGGFPMGGFPAGGQGGFPAGGQGGYPTGGQMGGQTAAPAGGQAGQMGAGGERTGRPNLTPEQIQQFQQMRGDTAAMRQMMNQMRSGGQGGAQRMPRSEQAPAQQPQAAGQN